MKRRSVKRVVEVWALSPGLENQWGKVCKVFVKCCDSG